MTTPDKMSTPIITPEILASARLHLDTAVSLVGRDQVQAWLSTPPNPLIRNVTATSFTTVTQKKPVGGTVTTTGTRGRKPGAIPPADQRCTWLLTSGDQCSNKRKEGNSLCGLHIGKIHLVDPATDGGGDDDE
jgi:hypothetical protein